MTNQTSKISPSASKVRAEHVVGMLGAVATLVASVPGLYGMVKGEGLTAPYVVLLGDFRALFGGESEKSEVPEGQKVPVQPVTVVPDQSAPPSKPVVVPPPGPVIAEAPVGSPMERMSSDDRLAMTLLSLKPAGPDSRQVIATYSLKSVGAPSQPFVLTDDSRKGWSVDADRAGHCYQMRESALDAFYRSNLESRIAQLPLMSSGQTIHIRAELYCQSIVVPGDTAVATATPYVLAADGSRVALPIRFQSEPTPVSP